MKKLTLILGLALVPTTGGTVQAATHEHDMSQHRTAMQLAASPARHEGFGVLKAVNAKAGKVQIAHEPIAALGWPPMTMWFVLRDPLPVEIKAGAAVRFELMQGESNQWVIVKIGPK
jgi:Cu/Ag efflux protein CusF